MIVVLRLKVDANGVVRDAQVVQSAGAKADQAALHKVYRLHFNPAHKDGQPVESTIRFRVHVLARGLGGVRGPTSYARSDFSIHVTGTRRPALSSRAGPPQGRKPARA